MHFLKFKFRTFNSAYQLLLVISLFAISLWFLLRLFLWTQVAPDDLTFLEILKTFALGAWFDIATLAYCLSPILLASALVPNRLKTSKMTHYWGLIFLGLVIFSLIFGLVAEYFFWQEFTTRFNFIAVDYLIYTNEVIGNIKESYPITIILIAIALLSLLLTFVIQKKYQIKPIELTWRQRGERLLLAVLLPALSYVFSSVDQVSAQSDNSYVQELGMNGLYSFAAAFRRNDLDYERFYLKMDKQKAQAILSNLRKQRPPVSNLIDSKNPQAPFLKRPKNVVMITVESLSAEYLGSYGNQQGLTPKLDALAEHGLVFDRLFATGTRTVRGLEALSLGTPPIPGQAIVRRPNNQHLSTVGEYLEQQGVITAFIYGGYGYFDNMNAYFSHNDYKVFDRTDFESKSIVMENVWGVADESLFDNTLQYIDKKINPSNPFFVQVMTTSNHRPYTFPDGRIDLPQGSRKAAVKYTDYAIGRFIAQAKTKPWFDDTLFVIVADHCASVAGKTHLPVAKYHIPMIFYAPKLVRPGHQKAMVSQIDIPPTMLNLLGYQGSEHFFGRNIFGTNHVGEERAFISNYQSLGYYKNNQLVVLQPKQKVEMFEVDPESLESTKTKVNQAMLDEAIAYYQTAAVDFKLGRLKELPLSE